MGTLTGNDLKLDEHCPHKLPASCRLTSTPLCCACADRRPHSYTYRVYVDGIGFVDRGTRWQGYCWYCKEFWTNRVEATNPSIPITRCKIPEVPDQTEFLQAWYEFHHGFKSVVGEDGHVYRVPLEFEPWIDVPPGYLPRLKSEVQAGQQGNRGVFTTVPTAENPNSESAGPEQSVEDAIDQLLNDMSDDESSLLENAGTSPSRRRESNGSRQVTASSAREQRRSRRENIAERMTRVFGTREEIMQDDYQSPIGDMFARAWRRYQTVQQSSPTQQNSNNTTNPDVPTGITTAGVNATRENEALSIVRANLMELGLDLHLLEQAFGTTEGQSDSVCPWRQHLFEINEELAGRQRRARQQMQNAGFPDPASSSSHSGYQSLAPILDSLNDPSFIEAVRRAGAPSTPERTTPPSTTNVASRDVRAGHTSNPRQLDDIISEPPGPGLDNDSTRPPAKSEDEMTVKLDCQVCYTQLATQALLPCGHMCMCTYCAEIAIPTLRHARTTPQGYAKCPVCRKKVNTRVKIHF